MDALLTRAQTPEISLTACAAKYGAGNYLAMLRRRMLARELSVEQFRSLAAQAYAAIGLTDRATALGATPPAAQPSLSPTCSLTMIVRNESQNIVPALESVDTLFDQIVICDTGSTDTTIELAQLFGITLVHHQWTDDFSAARNVAIDNAFGEWIFWMDADDRMEPRHGKALRRLWQTTRSPSCTLVRVVNLQQNRPGASFLQARLFPNHPDLRFERRIHEQIIPAAQRAQLQFCLHDEISVLHTGYNTAQQNSQKGARNEYLLQRELQEFPADCSLTMSLADAQFVQGKYQAAANTYRLLVQSPSAAQEQHDIWVQAHINLALSLEHLGKLREAQDFLELAVTIDRTHTDAWYYLGKMHHDSQSLDTAQVCFERACSTKTAVRTTATDSQGIAAKATVALAAIYLEQGYTDRAATLLTSALAQWPQVPRFHTLAGQTALQEGNLAAATRHFMHAIELAPAACALPHRGMEQIYSALGDSARADLFAQYASRLESSAPLRRAA